MCWPASRRRLAQESQELARERWSLECPQQVSLMIATIGGGPEVAKLDERWPCFGDGGALGCRRRSGRDLFEFERRRRARRLVG